MRPDVLVMRHGTAGAPKLVADHVSCAVVSAGDGAHEHPSQGLLDLYTLAEHFTRVAGGEALGTPAFEAIEGKTVTIVGDVSHSRVAALQHPRPPALGARVRLCGPPTMMPLGVEALGVEVHHRLRDAVEGADAVMMLRIQSERFGDPLIPGTREYSQPVGARRPKAAAWLAPHCAILHPGPMNRGVELSPEVADGGRSVILDQVENGVAVRMAILYLLTGAAAEEAQGTPSA